MKKVNLFLIIGIFVIVLIGAFAYFNKDSSTPVNSNTIQSGTNNGKGNNTAFESADAKMFKLEYESLNGVVAEGKQNSYVEVAVPQENPFKYAEYSDVKKLLENGTGILYLGFPECPWCRNLVPTLTDALVENHVKEVYYFNALSIRDKKHLDEKGNVVTDQEGTVEYYELVDMLKDHLGPYEGLNDESVKRIYFPTIVFVKDGKVVGIHKGTLDSQEDPQIPLDDKQKTELKETLTEYIKKVFPAKCEKEAEKAC